MSKVKFKLDLKGLNDLMKSAQMQEIVRDHATRIAGGASSMSGEEYSSDMRVLNYVAVGTAFPASPGARRDNSENNTLLKAVR